MPNVRLIDSRIDIALIKPPATEANVAASVEWEAMDRPELRRQTALVEEQIQVGDNLADELGRIQTAALSFVESVFTGRGETLASSPLQSLTIGYGYAHPFSSVTSLAFRVQGIWKAADYPRARAQVETELVTISDQHALWPDFETIATALRNRLVADYSEHTIIEGV